MAGDLKELVLKVLSERQGQLELREVAGLIALLDLWEILGMISGRSPYEGGNLLQEVLRAVSGPGENKKIAELLGGLGKNPALVQSIMNLLMAAKERTGEENSLSGKGSRPFSR